MTERKNQDHDSYVRQQGIVERIEDDKVFVRIYQNSACGGCAVSGGCSTSILGGDKGRLVEANGEGELKTGSPVQLQMRRSDGVLSVLLSFVLPLILIFAFVFTLDSLGISQSVLAIGALSIAGVYFAVLKLFSAQLHSRIRFVAVAASSVDCELPA